MPPSDAFFRDIKVLARKERKDEALRLLRKVASMVKPIMKNRGWKVGLLREFYPKNSALLGMNKNRGQEIMIRLRPHYDDKVFLEFNDILGTMLHELVHIVQGPHDQKFYALLDQLWEEYEKLVDSGFSGDGFESEGIRLGVGVSHNLPPEEARRRALAAAEKRRIQNELMINPGGVRLGG
ncbi:WLM domain-containing protein, partial [Paraphysoderma sedebokerense]